MISLNSDHPWDALSRHNYYGIIKDIRLCWIVECSILLFKERLLEGAT